jgi:hypothetical protein
MDRTQIKVTVDFPIELPQSIEEAKKMGVSEVNMVQYIQQGMTAARKWELRREFREFLEQKGLRR